MNDSLIQVTPTKEDIIDSEMVNEEDLLLKTIDLDLSIKTEQQTEHSNEIINISNVFRINFGQYARPKKLLPNYFFCIRISDQLIHDAANETQRKILTQSDILKDAMVKIKNLHITLFVMHLKDEQISSINDYLKKHIEERNMLQKDAYKAFALRLRGLNTFRNQVVFIDFHKNAYYDYLISIQKKIVKAFEGTPYQITDYKFQPHVTLMKMSKAKQLKKAGVKKIEPKWYENIKETHFGEEFVDKIYLCSITQKQDDGFYRIVGEFDLNNVENSIEL